MLLVALNVRVGALKLFIIIVVIIIINIIIVFITIIIVIIIPKIPLSVLQIEMS